MKTLENISNQNVMVGIKNCVKTCKRLLSCFYVFHSVSNAYLLEEYILTWWWSEKKAQTK